MKNWGDHGSVHESAATRKDHTLAGGQTTVSIRQTINLLAKY
jgi:hypothetical protein